MELREQQERHDQEQKNAQGRHDEQVNYLNEKHDADKRAAQDRHDAERKAMQERHDLERAESNARHDKDIKMMRERHDKEAQDAQERHRLDVERLNEQVRTQQEHYDSQIRRLHTEMRAKQQRHEDDLKATQEKHAADLGRLNAEHKHAAGGADVELRRTQEQHHAEMKAFREGQARQDQAHREEVEQMQAEHAHALRGMEDEHRRRDSDREERHAKENQLQIDKFDEMQKQMKHGQERLRSEKDAMILELKAKMQDTKGQDDAEIANLKNHVDAQEQTIVVLNSKNLALAEELERKKDIEAQLEEEQQKGRDNQLARETLLRELESGTEYILDLEEKVYKANKTSLELLKQLKDAEMEIEALKQYIAELKQRIAVYIPVRDDAVDKQLAEYINNYPERAKLKIMFMRESEGVYQFGTKRVSVKVEKNNIKIRVGGGYLSIDEFLDQYTPTELEKLDRNSPLKRFGEKIAVQKTIVNTAVRESSPVAGPGSPKARQPGSPKKSHRIQ